MFALPQQRQQPSAVAAVAAVAAVDTRSTAAFDGWNVYSALGHATREQLSTVGGTSPQGEFATLALQND